MDFIILKVLINCTEDSKLLGLCSSALGFHIIPISITTATIKHPKFWLLVRIVDMARSIRSTSYKA